MWDYTEKVKDHFLHPRHVGEIEKPDVEATVGNITCGDALRLMLRIDAKGRIADAKFQTFGCASAIASSDALIDLIKGKTIDEAAKVTNDDIAGYLGGLPEEKMHCSVMGMEALQKAISKYRHEPFAREEEGEIVCRCFGVTDKLIEKVVREHGLKTVEEVTHYTKAGGGCRGCHPEIEAIIARVRGEKAPAVPKEPAVKPMTNIERIRRVEEVMEKEIRPMLQADGGDIELVDVDGRRVQVAFRGHCAWCRVRDFTLKGAVEAKLRELVDSRIVVEDVGGRLPEP
ncbi:MAG TPA: Fe-S cluster assembly protein NifU [Phycisphaerae bacterium]|nr:Fe-S cluster assembly protein NifU [Phycisphaerae bacterium]